jgi:hypothetical protein
MRDALKVELPLRALFESTTIRGLAGLVEEAQRSAASVSLPEIIPIARESRRAILSKEGSLVFPPAEKKEGTSRG